MRIIAGTARGRHIATPIGGDVTRPTRDAVRESIFGIIQFSVNGSSVLDLFAGSGALGLEALSRGAKCAVFCDIDKGSVRCIKDNIQRLGFESNATVWQKDYMRVLQKIDRKFDIIFLDPPYSASLMTAAIDGILGFNLLNDGGIIVCEHHAKDVIPEYDRLSIKTKKLYRDTGVTIMINDGR